MIVLDTNVVSALMRKDPEPGVVRWVDQFPADDVFITAITAAELEYGVARLPDGRRKRDLAVAVSELLTEDFQEQILPFEGDAAAYYAHIAASRERDGRPISMADAQIAAICRRHDARLATRNVNDFTGASVTVSNPWNTGDTPG